MIVVDAGAVVEVLLGRGHGAPVVELLERHGDDAFAPEVLDLEVLQVLRRLARGPGAHAPASQVAVVALQQLPVRRVGHEALIRRAWQLRDVCTAYDAAYVALAEVLGPGCGLVTTDRRLGRAAETLGGIEVTVVAVP